MQALSGDSMSAWLAMQAHTWVRPYPIETPCSNEQK
jgi:hypothetical protein